MKRSQVATSGGAENLAGVDPSLAETFGLRPSTEGDAGKEACRSPSFRRGANSRASRRRSAPRRGLHPFCTAAPASRGRRDGRTETPTEEKLPPRRGRPGNIRPGATSHATPTGLRSARTLLFFVCDYYHYYYYH